MATKELSDRLSLFGSSATGAVQSKVNELIRQGQTILSLNIGEPDFDTPDTAKTAGIEAIRRGETKYTVISGSSDLRQAISQKLLCENGLNYSIDEICVSTGAKQALFEAVMAVCNEGDEVIIPVPSWVSYSAMVKIAGAVPVFVSSKEDFSLDIDKIEAAVTCRTKAVIICSPNNPSGAVYSEESLRALADLAVKYDFFVIADEIYEKLVYDGYKHFSIASFSQDIWERTITVNGFSKAYAMTGWRIGYAAARKDIIAAIIQLQSQITSCASSIGQQAAIGALSGEQCETEYMVGEFKKRRDLACRLLAGIPNISFIKPHGAFYILADISYYLGRSYDGRIINDAAALCEYLLDTVRVAAVPGDSFGVKGYIRISYSCSEETLSLALGRMKEALLLLK